MAQPRTHSKVRRRHAVDARHDLDALLDHREVSRVRAEIADVRAAHGEERSVGVKCEFGLDGKIAALIIAEQKLAALAFPLDRTDNTTRRPRDHRLLRN